MADGSPTTTVIDGADLVRRYAAGERDFRGLRLDGIEVRPQNHLAGSDFAGSTFRDAVLAGCTLDECKLTGCDFTGANLTGSMFRNEADLSGAVFHSANLTSASLHTAILKNANFEHATLTRAQLSAIVADSANFSGARLENTEWVSARLASARFSKAILIDANFRLADLSAANFSSAELTRVRFDEAQLEGVSVTGARLHEVWFHSARIGELNLEGVDLSGSRFLRNDLTRCRLRGARLGATKFDSVDLRGLDLRGVEVDDQTSFTKCQVARATIERNTLDCLEDLGGLTKGQLRTMKVIDGLSELRSNYSGFWQWLHMLALTIFVFPYVVYALQLYPAANPTCLGASCVTVASRFWTYVKTGGAMGDHIAWVPFLIFWFSLAYNLLRFVLLAKTKSLELTAIAAGFPPQFSLEDRVWRLQMSWGFLLAIASIGFYVNVVLVLLHLWHFMQKLVPA